MRNELVLENFLRGMSANNPSKNLVSTGERLMNYSTTIAKHFGGITLINGTKYSSTTSKHQNYLKANSFNVIVGEDDFNYLVNFLEYDLAYGIVQAMYQQSEETSVDYTSTLKRDAKLKDEGKKLIYNN